MQRKIIIILALFFNSALLVAQSEELLHTEWKADNIASIQNDIPPFDDIITSPEEFHGIATFYDDHLIVTNIECEVSLSSGIEYIGDNQFNLIPPFDLEDGSCDNPSFIEFSEAHLDFYIINGIPQNPFFYLISEQSNGSPQLAVANVNASNLNVVYTPQSSLSITEENYTYIKLSYDNRRKSFGIENITEPTDIRIYTVSGLLILSQTITPKESCDIAQLPNGLYLVQLETKSAFTKTMRFLKY